MRLITHPGIILKKFYLKDRSLQEFSDLSGIAKATLESFIQEKSLLSNEDISKLANALETTEEMWHRANQLYLRSHHEEHKT